MEILISKVVSTLGAKKLKDFMITRYVVNYE